MKTIGIFASSIIISGVLILINFLSGSGYIYSFIYDHAFDICTTLLGFNIAIHTILVGQITSIESQFDQFGYFKKTRKELKDNAIFNVILLASIFLLRSLIITKYGYIHFIFTQQLIKNINFTIEWLIMSAVVLIIFLILETIRAVYTVYSFKSKK